jgi:hypothetical protein
MGLIMALFPFSVMIRLRCTAGLPCFAKLGSSAEARSFAKFGEAPHHFRQAIFLCISIGLQDCIILSSNHYVRWSLCFVRIASMRNVCHLKAIRVEGGERAQTPGHIALYRSNS